jgi:hypothetical protein
VSDLVSTRPRTELAVLLDNAREFVTRHVVFRKVRHPESGATMTVDADAIALWIAHTFVIDCLDFSPRLILVSPEKESGKSRLLESWPLSARTRSPPST